MLKISTSNQSIGDFYGLHRNTISAYKNKAEYKLIYEALKAYYITQKVKLDKINQEEKGNR